MTPIPSPSANGRSSFSASRSMSEYCGCSVSTGAIDWMRRSCPVLEVRDADVPYQALLLELGEGRPALLDVLFRDRPVDLVQVDGLDAEPADARLGLAQDRIALEVVHDPAARSFEQ